MGRRRNAARRHEGRRKADAPAVKGTRLAPERAPRVELTIADLDHAGRGVGRVDGKVVFVDGALPGETVRVRYTHTHRRFDEGVVERRLQDAAERVEPFCPAFGHCGGCTLQHLDASAQVAVHERRVAGQLEHAAGHAPDVWLAPITGPARGYRCHARLGVRTSATEPLRLGFRARGGREVADLDGCPILDPRLDRLIPALKPLLAGLEGRSRLTGVRLCASEGDCAVTLRLDAEPTRADTESLRSFGHTMAVVPEVETAGGTRPVDGMGPAELYYTLPDEALTLRFASSDFVQVNPAVNRQLVAQALHQLAPQPGQCIYDLFCGLGNFALPMAQRGAEVVGLEGDAALVERAAANARANGLEQRARFVTADLNEAPLQRRLRRDRVDAVLLDPPRTGAPAAVTALIHARPARVVYVSCDPATLARDVARLVGDGGYRLTAAGIADMFPHTGHIECLVCLEHGRA